MKEPGLEGKVGLGSRFRKLTVAERRAVLAESCSLSSEEIRGFGTDEETIQRSNVMVEYSVGYLAVPLGIAPGFLIDGAVRNVPLATEEPSVIAAAAFAAGIVAMGGGFETRASDPVMTAQIYLRAVPAGREVEISRQEDAISRAVKPVLARMEARGGGLRGISVIRLPESGFVRVHLHIDVRDAMGANVLNSAAEAARTTLEQISGGRVIMAILSNGAEERTTEARFRIPVRLLARGRFTGEEVAAGITEAWAIADEDPARAVTHNKGIMNGISALALATANDTRGIEAAAHAFAARTGRYRSLSQFTLAGDMLAGSILAPLPFGTVGGAVNFHPGARAALKVLGNPDAQTLSRIAASLGLAQNLAALSALVSEGIQQGHMRLHARRIAFEAGARNEEVAVVARRLQADKNYQQAYAERILQEVRNA